MRQVIIVVIVVVVVMVVMVVKPACPARAFKQTGRSCGHVWKWGRVRVILMSNKELRMLNNEDKMFFVFLLRPEFDVPCLPSCRPVNSFYCHFF